MISSKFCGCSITIVQIAEEVMQGIATIEKLYQVRGGEHIIRQYYKGSILLYSIDTT